MEFIRRRFEISMLPVSLVRVVTILSRVKDIADTAQESRQQVVSLKEKLKGMHKVQITNSSLDSLLSDSWCTQ